MRARSAWLVVLLALAGCTPLKPADFAAGTPKFDPERFFLGHIHSWGVLETRGGDPMMRFETEIHGSREGEETLIRQHFAFDDGTTQDRTWHLRKLDATHYAATAEDVPGGAACEAEGNVFRMEYDLAITPGSSWKTVHLHQWIYALDDGSRAMTRVIVSKFGITLAEVAESFWHLPE